MYIDVFFLPQVSERYTEKMVIIIDVLRASSTIVTALANGCSSVITVANLEQAYQLKKEYPDHLLGGEREGLKVPGFDLGNSPLEYRSEIIKNKDLILTTSNGTYAIQLAQGASNLLIGSFLNLQRVIEKAFVTKQDMIFLCAGNERHFSFEDAFCAGVMIHNLREHREDLQFSDAAIWAQAIAGQELKNQQQLSPETLYAIIGQTEHGRKLKSIGFDADVVYCSQQNLCPVGPRLKDGKFII